MNSRPKYICLMVVILFACADGIEPPATTEMVQISEGLDFLFGSTEPCLEGEPIQCSALENIPITYPTVMVRLKPFAIDVHEVTNLQYSYCVAMGECSEPTYGNTLTVPDYYGNSQFDHYPVVNVTFGQATDYCAFVGRALPTEAQWERVAGGHALSEGSKRRMATDSFQSINQCVGKDVALQVCGGPGIPNTAGISADDSVLEGGVAVRDLAGNVSEWTRSYKDEDVTCLEALPPSCDCYACQPDDTSCFTACYLCDLCQPEAGQTEGPCFMLCPEHIGSMGVPICIPYAPTNVWDEDLGVWPWPVAGSSAVVRGGNYFTNSNSSCTIRSADRSMSRPIADGGQGPTVGFRCAKDL
jgi:formylglycine-generating enzyme required for sulfatase activity